MVRGLALLLVLVWGPMAAAQDTGETKQDVIFILDASGSMWGTVDDEIKMDIAKSVSTRTISELSDTASVGLIAYGHRTEGDCADIETLVPLKNTSNDKLNVFIQNLQPKGRTPLTKAVRKASDALKSSGSNTSIVLITDGLETCGGDPCALGRELAASGTGLKTHIVGFDLAGRNTSALQCLAAETGGTYTDASNRSELTDALRATTRDIKKNAPTPSPIITPPSILTTPAPLPGEERSQPEKIEKGTLQLTARLTETSDILKRPVLNWELFRTDDGGDPVSVVSEPGVNPTFNLPNGDYTGRVSGEDMSVDFKVSVVGGKLTEDTITLGAGFVRVVPKGKKGVASILVLQNGSEIAREAATSRGVKLLLAEGDYEVVGSLKGETKKLHLFLTAGEEKRLELDFSPD